MNKANQHLKKILAIDDNQDNLIVLKALLSENFVNLELIYAQNGQTGIDLCYTEMPDVILLDIVMPGMDGFEVCRKLKSDESIKHIPIVMLTATRTGSLDRIKALEMGADAFLSKPIDEPEFYAQVKAMIRLKDSEDRKRNEATHLAELVQNRTRELEMELAKHRVTENELKKSLEEKELLLRELLHRTKNSMQVISSMLHLCASIKNNDEVVAALMDMSYRIDSMSLVHQKLYKSQDLSSINLNEYITELMNMLIRLLCINKNKIEIKFELENIYVLIDYAVPCGLIINEIVTNAMKHGFPDGRTGEFLIKLQRLDDSTICMELKDNGIGLPDGFDQEKHAKFGMLLIKATVSHQLGGRVDVESNGGVGYKITFLDNKYTVRI